MKLIVGLGNPGKKYQDTRHNVGYLFIDALGESGLPKGVIAKQSGVFMNASGSAVATLCTKYKIQSTNLYVVHDDLDLPLGEYKIQFGKGPKDHKGLKSVDEALGTKDYWRIRLGVDKREPNSRTSGEEHVLQNFTGDEKKAVGQVIARIIHEKFYQDR